MIRKGAQEKCREGWEGLCWYRDGTKVHSSPLELVRDRSSLINFFRPARALEVGGSGTTRAAAAANSLVVASAHSLESSPARMMESPCTRVRSCVPTTGANARRVVKWWTRDAPLRRSRPRLVLSTCVPCAQIASSKSSLTSGGIDPVWPASRILET